MFFNDKPINKISDDILGRKEFSSKVAETFSRYNNKESLVFSLIGDWGSGKTSVINMIQENCETNFSDRVKVIKFNPWYYSDKSNLILKFFENIFSNELLIKDKKKRKKYFTIISNYANGLESASVFIPPVSSGFKALKVFADFKANKYSSQLTDIETQKAKVGEIFNNLDYKLLVIIDDIDRLTSEEIRDIFQLVKLVADLPNIIYLLSFDINAVLRALEGFQNGKGEEYLEKIIQVPFYLPDIPSSLLEKYLFSKIDEIIINVKDEDFNKEQWSNLYFNGLKQIFKNIRHINRFINVFKFEFQLLIGKTNIVDLIGITAIKIHSPDLYEIIKTNKSLFIRSYSNAKYDSLVITDDNKYKTILTSLLNKYIDNRGLIQIIINLFPKTYTVLGDRHYTSIAENYNQNRLEQRICDKDFFDTYFTFSFPSGIISNSEMESLIFCSDKDIIANKLIEIDKAGKINDFLSRVEDYKNKIDISNIPTLVFVILNLGSTFTDEPTVGRLMYLEWIIIRIINMLLERISDRKERFEILKSSVLAVTNDISLCVDLVANIDSTYGRFGREDQKKRDDELLIDEDCLNELEIICLQRINEYADNDKIFGAKDFISVLYRWREWGGENNLKIFLNNIYKDKQKTIILLMKFIGRTNYFDGNNKLTMSKEFLQYNHVIMFLDTEFIYKQLKSLTEEEINKLDDILKKVINYYFESYEAHLNKTE